MAHKFWPNADPVGELITIGKGYAPGFDEPARQIVGIASDIHEGELNRDPSPMLYVPIPQVAEGITALFSRVVPLAFAVGTRVEPHSFISSIENEIRQVSAELPIAEVRSMDEISLRSTSRQDFNMLLMTIFGASALLLAAIGIYGLLAYSVKQRTQEIGIRLALGADAAQVRNMVVLQGVRLALAGLATGMIAAFGLARVLQGFLFEVRIHDPVVFTAVPVVLCVVTFLAVWLPASRAARIDPAIALRSE
jgi:putative ABC transport system permease protein